MAGVRKGRGRELGRETTHEGVLTNQDFNIRLVDVNNEKNNGFLAGVSLPPSSRPPRVSLAPKTLFPKTPFPFPFKRLPRRLSVCFYRCHPGDHLVTMQR